MSPEGGGLMREVRRLGRALGKAVLCGTLYREGAVRTVLIGPSRGLKYRIFANGRAPIYGGWERQAQRFMAGRIRAGQVVYDVGANAGIHTLLMARLATARGHVYAFEPHPAIHEALVTNVALNGLEAEVTPVQMAVTDATGRSTFYSGQHGGAGHLGAVGYPEGEGITVETITLDAFVFGRGHRPPDFVKIDVEGAEGKVMDGGQLVLRSHRPTLLIDLHNPEQDLAVGRVLAALGYAAYRTRDMSRVASLSAGWPDPHGLWGQIVAVPED
jgi:FkbM family methyltransferase